MILDDDEIELHTGVVVYVPRGVKHKAIGADPVFLRMAGPDGQDLRVLAQTALVADESGQRTVPYTFLVASDRGELEAEIAIFNRSLVWSLGGLGLLLVIAVFIQVRYGILPLRRIPAALAAIRSGRSERLTGQFSAEVEPLAEELNKLIDHNKEVVDRARTHVGNVNGGVEAVQDRVQSLVRCAQFPGLGFTLTFHV